MFGLLSGLVAVPAIVGTTEAVRQGQRQNAREQHRGRKSNLVVKMPFKSMWSSKFDGALVVLKEEKLYVDISANQTGTPSPHHPFSGYYLPHPENQGRWKGAGWTGEGMVSTISEDPPYLNWIYVDRFTHEVKYGNKLDTVGHQVGPWDCTAIDRRVTFEGWEGFFAVQEYEDGDAEAEEGLWALYFDRDDNFLTSSEGMIGKSQRRKLQVLLERREKVKTRKEEESEREERKQRREEKEEKERKREEEKKVPVQQVFKTTAPEDDELDVRVRHEEEVDD